MFAAGSQIRNCVVCLRSNTAKRYLIANWRPARNVFTLPAKQIAVLIKQLIREKEPEPPRIFLHLCPNTRVPINDTTSRELLSARLIHRVLFGRADNDPIDEIAHSCGHVDPYRQLASTATKHLAHDRVPRARPTFTIIPDR